MRGRPPGAPLFPYPTLFRSSASGLITIAGGKLTTFRVMGRDMVDRVARRLHQLDGHAVDHRSEEHTSELQSPDQLVCRLLLEKKKPIPNFSGSTELQINTDV